MSKLNRQNAILKFISEFEIETQEEILEKLKLIGINTTQATVSRDINELKLIKVPAKNRLGNKYKKPDNLENDNQMYLKVYKNVVIDITTSENLIVIKTAVGNASPVAALIDKLNIENILGVIAGDDTIFIAINEKKNTSFVAEKLKDMLE